MSLLWKAFDLLWKNTEKSDAKIHSTQTEAPGIERVCDIPYIDDGNHYHLLDVYYPEKRNGNLPVIIDIHGGGWMYADKDLNKFYNLELAARGFCVFSISYRLCPSVTVNEQIQDCMSALLWIQNNIRDYPADADKIMLTGDSAGGMLAAFCAALLSCEELRTVFGTVNPGMKLTCATLTSPVAYMNTKSPMGIYTRMMWGDWKNKPTAAFMNFDALIDFAELPPMLLITSSGDFLAESQTHRMAAELKARHIPCKIVDYPEFDGRKLPHVFSVTQPASEEGVSCINLVENYYRKVMTL